MGSERKDLLLTAFENVMSDSMEARIVGLEATIAALTSERDEARAALAELKSLTREVAAWYVPGFDDSVAYNPFRAREAMSRLAALLAGGGESAQQKGEG